LIIRRNFLDYKVAEEEITYIISKKKTNVLQNIVDYLYENFDKYNWVGIYIVKNGELVLGPWKGKQVTEHTKIPIGKGICGSAAHTGKIEIVPDVSKDERYISCFIYTRSEIVVPIKKNGDVIGEIDIDSDISNAFNDKDILFLEYTAAKISSFI
jgi:GAF domain-containing protein